METWALVAWPCFSILTFAIQSASTWVWLRSIWLRPKWKRWTQAISIHPLRALYPAGTRNYASHLHSNLNKDSFITFQYSQWFFKIICTQIHWRINMWSWDGENNCCNNNCCMIWWQFSEELLSWLGERTLFIESGIVLFADREPGRMVGRRYRRRWRRQQWVRFGFVYALSYSVGGKR